MSSVRIATRTSALAMAQSKLVGDQLAAHLGVTVDYVPVTTRGDVDSSPLATIGGTGVFVVAVRAALLDGRADLSVHSAKDLPTAPADGLTIAAVPTREDPRDALCSAAGVAFAELPRGARIGTSSPRRAAALQTARPDLQVVDIRGNVDTRLAKLAKLEFDAIVLAVAGLSRIGRLADITEILDLSLMLPAPGQGALAIEARPGALADEVAACLDDSASHAEVRAETALLAELGLGCSAAVGALARASADQLVLRAATYGARARQIELVATLDEAVDLGRRAGADLALELVP